MQLLLCSRLSSLSGTTPRPDGQLNCRPSDSLKTHPLVDVAPPAGPLLEHVTEVTVTVASTLDAGAEPPQAAITSADSVLATARPPRPHQIRFIQPVSHCGSPSAGDFRGHATRDGVAGLCREPPQRTLRPMAAPYRPWSSDRNGADAAVGG
jgi:hypothetical protein